MMALATDLRERTATTPNADRIFNHLVKKVEAIPFETDPFCHFYGVGLFPGDIYADILANLPDPKLYTPLNLRLYSRADGKSTRDQFHLTPEAIADLPQRARALWTDIVAAVTRPEFRRIVFSKLAPDLALRFGTTEEAVANKPCNYEVVLMRDTEDYTIKPHPDGLNKIVTMQFYLAPDMSQVDLGTSLYNRKKKLFRSSFEEIKRFQFLPNSGYAFAVSDSPAKQSWHGREVLTGFKGTRNTLMVLFQQNSPRSYGDNSGGY